jgi:hypothetical protein
MNVLSRIVVTLAMLLQVTAALAQGTAPVANLLIVDNEVWRTDLAVVAPDGEATVRISDCNAFGGAYTVPLAYGDGLFLPDVSRYQCSRTRLGVVKLPILNGEPRLWTQAHYRDANGNTSFVVLPTLPDALPRSQANRAQTFTAEYVFDGIENASAFQRSTFVALIPDGGGTTQVELTVSSYSSPDRAITETVTVNGFTFHELLTPVEFGRLTVRHIAPPGYSGPEPGLFAVAFIGDARGGSPRVEVPQVRYAISID